MAVWGWNDIDGNGSTMKQETEQTFLSQETTPPRQITGAIICAIFIAIVAYFSYPSISAFPSTKAVSP